MHEQIMGYSSAVFYQGQLKAHASVAGHKLFSADGPWFRYTAGCGFDKDRGVSTSNPEEAAFLFKHLTQFAGELTHITGPAIFPASPSSRPTGDRSSAERAADTFSPSAGLWRQAHRQYHR